MEVDVAHPGLHMTGLGLHGHKATVHEVDHISDGIEGRHLFLNLTIIVVEDLYLMREIEIIVDGILVSVEFLGEVFVDRLSLGDIFDEMGNFLMAFVLPGIGVAPVLVEGLLHLFHLLDGSLLSIALQAGVEGSVDLQTFGIEGVAVVEVVLAPIFQIIAHSLAEVVGIAVIG